MLEKISVEGFKKMNDNSCTRKDVSIDIRHEIAFLRKVNSKVSIFFDLPVKISLQLVSF